MDRFTSRRRSVQDVPVTSILAGGDVPFDPNHPNWTADEEVLAALGYKAEFKREFGLMTTFAVSFAVLGLLPSFASTLYYGMGYAGTAGMTWGWVVALTGIMAVAASMAEICSSMPTSGGLYYAAAVLAPPGWGPFAAWVTGWSNWLAQVTAAPSINWGIASMTLAAKSITDPSFHASDYQVFLLTSAFMIIHAFMASVPTRWIANINSFGSILNIMTLIIVLIMIPAGTNREEQGISKFNKDSAVWGDIYKGTAYPDGISVLMSFIAVIWTMSGYDSPFHLAEECSNANVASPRAIVLTGATGGVFGWFLQLVVAYTVVDIDGVLESDIGQPFAAYLAQCMSQKMVLAILSLTIIAGFFMGQGAMIAASRVTFAYARDDCFGPASGFIKKVHPLTSTPVNAVWFNAVVGIGTLFLIFGGEIAIGALFSIGALAAFFSFATPIFIRAFLVGDRFRRGPWHLGKFSIPIAAYASAFVLLMIPILCLPSVVGKDLTAETMNWTCVVWGGPMAFVTVWWFVSAKHWFKGPKVNVDHMIHNRTDAVLEGKPMDSDSGSDNAAPVGEKKTEL
ncbi:amino acid transporter [Patellaria atrata CBS 101060]|uniref:Amino acid transporter n=1 Tax=Patellaria atrata CBS 101060 TaxID=1346257 RepID=A0A9P4S7E4_9PEZI|nr:amino acid transporter [Patellaria atrata CBS 101060]